MQKWLVAGGLAAAGIMVGSMAPRAEVKGEPTFATDIAPLIFEKCTPCHRQGQVAPFSLLSYEDAKSRATTIARVVEKRFMPPWKAVSGYGSFKHENRLTDGQIRSIRAWADAGAPRGDASKEPKPPAFSTEWALGKPDLVLSAEKDYKLSPEGEDVYRNFVIKTNYSESKWIRAIDVAPGNRKVVHHVIAFLDGADRAKALEAKAGDGQPGYESSGGGVGFMPDGALGGWAPGLQPFETPKGTAFELKPGTTIVLQVHYHKSGKEETDRTKLAVYLAGEKIEREMRLAWIANPFFRLQPGNAAQPVNMAFTLPYDVTAYGAMPHMHLLGRSMKAWVEMPDGKEIPLVHIDGWDFNWQLTYEFLQPLKLPAGATIRATSIYDNSKDNINNPNSPPKLVRWGEQTTDEMALLIVSYTRDTPVGD
ncbi:MAG: ascorbate-dependent monooxygenase [Armatimonadota bacterium]|nr:ascorbate-dependent monooxygenase [Armatimonadota bacterium]